MPNYYSPTMSAIFGNNIGGAFPLNYSFAYQQGRQALFERNLSTLSASIDKGDLSRIKANLKTVTTNNPQFSTQAPDSSAVAVDFKALAKAIDDKKLTDVKKAWKQLKTDLSEKGITPGGAGITASRAQAALEAASKQGLYRSVFSNQTLIYGAGGSGLSFNANTYPPGSFLDAQI